MNISLSLGVGGRFWINTKRNALLSRFTHSHAIGLFPAAASASYGLNTGKGDHHLLCNVIEGCYYRYFFIITITITITTTTTTTIIVVVVAYTVGPW